MQLIYVALADAFVFPFACFHGLPTLSCVVPAILVPLTYKYKNICSYYYFIGCEIMHDYTGSYWHAVPLKVFIIS